MEAIGVAISSNSNCKHFMNLSFSKYYYYLFRIILYISFLKGAFRQDFMLQLVAAKCEVSQTALLLFPVQAHQFTVQTIN